MDTAAANAHAAPAVAAAPAGMARVIAAASVGNALEFYDIVVYGLFATPIAHAFFPNDNATVSLLLTWGAFGVTFLARPLGAVLLGAYADRAGRKAALTLGILLMTLGTFLLAVMPRYATLGLLAPLGVLAARLIQGFAVGGEFGSATAMMMEHAPRRAGFFASFQFSSQALAGILGAGVAMLITGTLPAAALDAWGWRLPFVFGLLIGPVGLYIRRHVDETPAFLAAPAPATPIRTLFAGHKTGILLTAGLIAMATGVTYLDLLLPTYAVRQLGLPPTISLTSVLTKSTLSLFLIPLVGHWSDRIGRTRLAPFAAVAMLLLVYPGFLYLVGHPAIGTLLGLVVVSTLLQVGYNAALPALMGELFPVQTRSGGMSVGYSLGVMTFGGFAPTIITWLIPHLGSIRAPSFYVIFCALVSLAALAAVPGRTARERTR